MAHRTLLCGIVLLAMSGFASPQEPEPASKLGELHRLVGEWDVTVDEVVIPPKVWKKAFGGQFITMPVEFAMTLMSYDPERDIYTEWLFTRNAPYPKIYEFKFVPAALKSRSPYLVCIKDSENGFVTVTRLILFIDKDHIEVENRAVHVTGKVLIDQNIKMTRK